MPLCLATRLTVERLLGDTAMIPGPQIVIACPECGALAVRGTLVSGNTFGEIVWTDVKRVAPMLPRPPHVVRCGQCAACYWLDDAKKVGEMSVWQDDLETTPAEWREAPSVEEPDLPTYYAALEAGLAVDPDEERNLRILTWWRSNDPYRRRKSAPNPVGLEQTERAVNMRALLALLDLTDDENQLMAAEILRELGRWSEAEAILDQLTTPELSAPVEQLQRLCRNRDWTVNRYRL